MSKSMMLIRDGERAFILFVERGLCTEILYLNFPCFYLFFYCLIYAVWDGMEDKTRKTI